MTMRLLVDMNLSPAWVGYLDDSGVQAVHWSTIEAHDAADLTIFNYAVEHAQVIFTHDLDFGAILAHTHNRRPSVIQVRTEDLNPETLGPTVLKVLRQFTAELEAGAIITVFADRNKVRILPL